MRRRFPGKKCEGCKRLVNGQFSNSCRQCSNHYSAEYISRGAYSYMGTVLTVREWAALAECSSRALYVQLENAFGSIEEALLRMGKLHIVKAKLEWRQK